MRLDLRHPAALLSLTVGLAFTPARAQQAPPPVIQTGALNVPTDVLTQNNQWSGLVPILSTTEEDLYIEDPSGDAWLSRNAQRFVDTGQYTITFVSFYKTVHACRTDQVHAGADIAHQNACNDYRYRIRQVAVDSPQNLVTLRYSVMVFTGGTPDPSSIIRETGTRGFSELTPDAQKAVSNATRLVGQQSHTYISRKENRH